MLAVRITLPHFSVSSATSRPKSAGEPASTVLAEVGKAGFHLGISEADVDFPVQRFNDLGGGVPGGADTVPLRGFIAGHELGYGRDVRQ